LTDKGTGKKLQGTMNCSANSVLRGRKSAVDDFVSFGDISWWMSAEDSAKHVANSAVHVFADSLGLRVLCSSRDQLDPIDIKHRLKGNAGKFSAPIMNDAKRARVRRKPLIFEVHGNMLRSLVVNADEFGYSCSRIYDS
jgi:hypothetical protein